MSESEVVDGEVMDSGRTMTKEEHEEGHRLPGELVPVANGPALAVTPTVTAGELVDRLQVVKDAAEQAMEENIDYGKVPGTDKPTLFKPGAEKLGVLFQLDVQLRNEKTWGPGDHLTVVSHATVFHAPSGARLGYGEGICTTRERKYAYRQAQRQCPDCGTKAIIKGKADYGGGFLCWKKKDGCGAKFDDNDPRIISQEVGEIENPDLPDLWNTVEKMASKRARVDAVLAVTGASAIFTQDLDDQVQPAPEEEKPLAREDSSIDAHDRVRSDSDPANQRQREFVHDLLKQFSDADRLSVEQWIKREHGKLVRADASWLIDHLKDRTENGRLAVLNVVIPKSDVPGDTEGLPE